MHGGGEEGTGNGTCQKKGESISVSSPPRWGLPYVYSTVHSCISIGWKTNEKRSGKKCCWWNLQVSISYFQHLFRFWTWIILKIFDIFLKITKQNLTWHSQTGGVDTPVYYKKTLVTKRHIYAGNSIIHLFTFLEALYLIFLGQQI